MGEQESIDLAEKEGERAGRNEHRRPPDCPYTFDRASMTVDQFNAERRPLLDAWFRGYLRAREER